MDHVPLYVREDARSASFLGSSALASDVRDVMRGEGDRETVPEAEQDPTSEEPGEGMDYIAFPDEDEQAVGAATEDGEEKEPEEEEREEEEETTRQERDGPPWELPPETIASPWLRLHEEILAFARFVAPTKQERNAREEAVERVRQVIESIWKNAQLQVFGSFATGLYLPTSDIDAVILRSGCRQVQDGLRALANALSRRGMAKNVQVISKARVPIIKFQEKESGFQFDISFDVANGPQAAQFLNKWLQEIPQVRPICLVVKFFLQQRELNEVYTGGIGSYALLTMIVAFLKTHPSRRNRLGNRKSLEGSLGVLLVDFFRLYGKLLNKRNVGITASEGGMFYNKEERNFFNDGRPYLLSVQDPVDSDNDLARNSYNISKVTSAFDFAFQMLTTPKIMSSSSILEAILDWKRDSLLIERAELIKASISDNSHTEEKHETDDVNGDNATPKVAKSRKRKGKRRKGENSQKKQRKD